MGDSPFYLACLLGLPSAARLLLADSRVKNITAVNSENRTALWYLAFFGYHKDKLDTIKVWIASGRDIDLGPPGDFQRDAIMAAERASSRTETEKKSRLETIDLMKRFGRNPVRTRRDIRVELGWTRLLAFDVFALVVFVSDGLLEIKTPDVANPASRFFGIMQGLPMELQMIVCYRLAKSAGEIISSKESEWAFVNLSLLYHGA